MELEDKKKMNDLIDRCERLELVIANRTQKIIELKEQLENRQKKSVSGFTKVSTIFFLVVILMLMMAQIRQNRVHKEELEAEREFCEQRCSVRDSIINMQ